MKIRFFSFLTWILFFGCVLVGGLGLNLTKVEAQALPILPMVQFTAVSDSHLELDKTEKIKIDRIGDTTKDILVNYIVTGTATASVDYNLSSGTVEIAPGETSVDLNLTIINDNLIEKNETIIITLSVDPTVAALGINQVFTYTIIEDNTPTTVLIKDPAAALGQNGWFRDVPEITLSVDRQAVTYYQWDGHQSGKWSIYNGSFSALEGDHTLYYYSDSGNNFIEILQSETFKVDTKHPIAPILNIVVNDDGKVQLSWQKISGVVKFKIFRDGRRIATLSGNDTTFDDWISTNGKVHSYSVIAFDLSGNLARSEVSSAQVAETVSTVLPESPNVIEIKPVVAKRIDTGASISATQVAQQPVTAPEEIKGDLTIEPPKDNESEPEESRNWNKLLLIISILIIAAGVATGGYYGYEWYMNRKDDGTGNDDAKNKSRW